MRTSNHKDEFINLEELHLVKNTIEEIENQLKSKLEIDRFEEEKRVSKVSLEGVENKLK